MESESIEQAALQDLHDAADEADINDLGLKVITVGSSFVSVARNLPASAIVVNRTLGLGLSAAASREEIVDIVACYRESAVAEYFVQLHPATYNIPIPIF